MKVMGLLDKARDETKHYIAFDAFIYYLAYFTNETLTEVVTWLSYHQIEIAENITEYSILENLRIELNRLSGYDLFEALEKLNEYGFFWQFDVSEYEEEESFKSAFYFYYDIRQLNEFPIFKELGINFYNADDLSFILTQSTDKVTISDKPSYTSVNGIKVHRGRKIKYDKSPLTDLGEFDENDPIASRIHYIFKSALSEKNEPSDNQTDHASTELHTRIAELEREITDKDERIAELESVGGEPVINATVEMGIINAVYHEFWENHQSQHIPPKKDTVKAWIKENYQISDNLAGAIDSIVRPQKYRDGGQKKRKS